MLKVSFYAVGENEGYLCDECGRYITHIVEIQCDGYKFRVGEECYENITHKMNLSEYGQSVLKKAINQMRKYRREQQLLKNRDRKGLEKAKFYAPFYMRDGYNERGEWVERKCETEEEFAKQCDEWYERWEKSIAEMSKKAENLFHTIGFKKSELQALKEKYGECQKQEGGVL